MTATRLGIAAVVLLVLVALIGYACTAPVEDAPSPAPSPAPVLEETTSPPGETTSVTPVSEANEETLPSTGGPR